MKRREQPYLLGRCRRADHQLIDDASGIPSLSWCCFELGEAHGVVRLFRRFHLFHERRFLRQIQARTTSSVRTHAWAVPKGRDAYFCTSGDG
ncbi:MAG: hypothetical protein MK135_04375 [Polyangiaceae bacterium]|nr:hypothetical protein [Polyangiaceae bacterium]